MNFNDLEISNEIKMALEDMGFENPTPIQEEVIPIILDKRDVIAQAPTGTGKTCAFGIPVINNIDFTLSTVQALILCPTRELVIQTQNELKEAAKYYKDLKILSVYGGQNIDRQLGGLKKNPQIIIGTTGRIMDHLRRRSLKLQGLRMLILDEVDEMLDMGFREDIDVILESAPKERQTVMFSATLPKEILDISTRYQNEPVKVKTQHEESDLPDINQFYVIAREPEKVNALVSIMKEKQYGLALVFCNTKKRVDELCTFLNGEGFAADALHGDLRQMQRDKTMRKFRSGETQILIATDVAARGIDVENIEAVFNFDVPHDEEYYVHRIGRTARAKRTGTAYTFVSEKAMYTIRNFERYTKSVILKAEYANLEKEITVDKKRFDKTVKIIKKSDLTVYKNFLSEEIIKLNEKYKDMTMLDIAAALLMQASVSDSVKVFSEQPKTASKDSVGFKSSRPRIKGGVKYFMNIGTRDKCDEVGIKKFISAKANIPFENILEVNCLENFSFATLTEGNTPEMENLNGLKFNNRFLAVEVASDKPKSPARKKEFGKDSGKGFAPKSRKKEYADSENEPKSDFPKKSYGNKKEFAKPSSPKKPEKFYNKTAKNPFGKGKKKHF